MPTFIILRMQSAQLSPHSSRFRQAYLIGAGALIALCAVHVVRAIDDLQLEVERIDGDGWSATGLAFDLKLPNAQAGTRATIERFVLAGQQVELRNVRIDCPSLEVTAATIICANARIAANIAQIGAQALQGRIAYERRSGAVDLDITASQLIGGTAHVQASLRDSAWKVRARLEDINVQQALKLAKDLKAPLPALTAIGQLNLEIEASGAATVRTARLSAAFFELTANNESGTLASDKLGFTTRAQLNAIRDGWDFSVDIATQQGQAYLEPVFIDFAERALALKTKGRLHSGGVVDLQTFDLNHRDVLHASGSARIDSNAEQPVRDLRLELHGLQFPGAYASYLQPFLLDSDFKSLTTAGRISGRVEVANGTPARVALDLIDVSFDDGTRKFALQGLSGAVRWADAADADEDVVIRAGSERSQLSWQGGSVLNMNLGRAALQFTAQGRQFRLLEATRIPFVDGAIDLESFRIRNVGSPTVAFMVDATIQPISVAQLSKAFGWPEFGGSVGGSISKLRLRDGIVTLGTTLQAQVFDGKVAIRDLRLEDTFGKWPRFRSSIELDNLDLEQITSAFAFGRITGRLSGSINELQLFNWAPIGFDAKLFTPPNDRSRHRISQRAVENIGSIGGGGAGISQALSSGFLRFFDEFKYERLGLSCRLENDVCFMDGVAPAPNGGYYLVKGAGIPRIDVIGGARRVDWPRLVQQLIAVSESEGPVVQ